MSAYALVLGKSFMSQEEFATRKPSTSTKLKVFARSIVNSQLEAIDTASVWVPKLLKLFPAQ